MPAAKIATCCYCGTRAALVLRGRERHELSCASCGAPLHAMKLIPVPGRETAPAATPTRPDLHRPHRYMKRSEPDRPRKGKRRKSLGRKVWSEVWDALEDIFD